MACRGLGCIHLTRIGRQGVNAAVACGRNRIGSIGAEEGRLDDLVPKADGQALQAAAPEPKTLRWYGAGHG